MTFGKARIGTVALGLMAIAGCWQGSSTPSPRVEPADYLAGLPTGADQEKIVCARGNQDAFAQWYCGTHPVITSLEDVLQGVGLKDPLNPTNMNFAINGHSTSL